MSCFRRSAPLLRESAQHEFVESSRIDGRLDGNEARFVTARKAPEVFALADARAEVDTGIGIDIHVVLTFRGHTGCDDRRSRERIVKKGWQVRKRAIGHRPRIEALPSIATATSPLS